MVGCHAYRHSSQLPLTFVLMLLMATQILFKTHMLMQTREFEVFWQSKVATVTGTVREVQGAYLLVLLYCL